MNFPLPPDEERRLDELRRYALLDTPPEKAFDNITALATRIFKVPISTVTLLDEDRQWFKSCIGLETREVGRNYAFCAYAILTPEILVIPDALEDARFINNPLVAGPPHIRFYAGAPLRTSNGLNLGTLTIGDTKPRELSGEGIATLATLASLVVDEIQLRYEMGERRRAEESLRLLQVAVQQSRESVMITTAELGSRGPEIVFVNPAFTKATGYSAGEVVGKTPQILQGPKTQQSVLEVLRTQLARGEEFHGELVNYRKDGSDFVFSITVSPLRGTNGEITHFISLQRDETERDRAAASLRQAKEAAERSNRAKSEFLSGMSHELRTPLHAMLGFAQLLEMDSSNSQDRENAEQIGRAGKHLLGLINEVLDLARVESGNLTFTPEPIDVRETLVELLSLVKPLAAERGVRLEPLAGELDCKIFSSAQGFKQVILNLLSNAVKFNREGGTVSVSCEELAGCVRIRVADTGRGISLEDQARLFVPFQRLGTGGTIEGTGLGLALSKQLIEAMGGKIDIASRAGEGTAFLVDLPLMQEAAPAHAPTLDAPSAGVSEEPRSPVPITLLHIEDNLSNLKLVERILGRRPAVRLISASQGAAGLDLARQKRPDVILLDLNLADISGDEILRQLRDDPRTAPIPVIMVSADATFEQIEKLRVTGATDYLTKPIDVRRFLEVVDATERRVARNGAG